MARVSPRWENERTVGGFVRSPPNRVLMDHARALVAGREPGAPPPVALDIGCGAGRNAFPLAAEGFRVVASDLSGPMLDAARDAAPRAGAVALVRAPMAPLPFADARFDLVVAHGIWNLARSDAEFRAAVAEGARVARPGARLFLFTFSRNTLPPEARPLPGERYAFTDFASEPQCFLTEAELLAELASAGWTRDPPGPLTEYNRTPGRRLGAGPPVIYEGTFVRRSR